MKKEKFIGKTLETSVEEAGFVRQPCVGSLKITGLEDMNNDSKLKSFVLETSYFAEEELLELAKNVVNFYSRSFKFFARNLHVLTDR